MQFFQAKKSILLCVWMLKAIQVGVYSCCRHHGRWRNAWSDVIFLFFSPALVQENAVVLIHFLWQRRCHEGWSAWKQVQAVSCYRGFGGTFPHPNSFSLCVLEKWWPSSPPVPQSSSFSAGLLSFLSFQLLTVCLWSNQPVSGLCQSADCK